MNPLAEEHVDCPYCKATKGKRCVTRVGQWPGIPTLTHMPRVLAFHRFRVKARDEIEELFGPTPDNVVDLDHYRALREVV